MIDDEDDFIVKVEQIGCKKNGNPCPLVPWLSFNGLDIKENKFKTYVKFAHIDFNLVNKKFDEGYYEFTLRLSDHLDNSNEETIFIELHVLNDDNIDYNNIQELMYSDHQFFARLEPGCGNIIRLYSIDFFFNGTKGSVEEEIYYTMLEPSLFIDMPTEEFYAKINPEVGFDELSGKFRGDVIQ